MGDGKRSLLVAASSKYADKLVRRTSTLKLERGKGKGKESDKDLELEETKQGSNGGLEGPKREGPSRGHHASTASPSLRVKRASTLPSFKQPDEDYINPFTGIPVIRDTGFEPGSSRKVPPLRRELHRTATAPIPRISQPQSKVSASRITTSPRLTESASRNGKTSPPPSYDTWFNSSASTPAPAADNMRVKEQTVHSSCDATANSALSADEAFARSLQQEEFLEIQRERDMFLSDALANGTVDDGDIELAQFMLRETEDLIAATGGRVGNFHHFEGVSQAGSSEWDAEREQMRMDRLYALELERALNNEDASISEALRLQAEFDAEIEQAKEHDEAWEEWKKTNIVECIVCGDEHHTEELLRPCEHGYCEGCLQEGFKNAMASKTPLKCCKKILNIDDCSGLEASFVKKYKDLVVELTTQSPMYCCNKSCSKFLPPSAILGEIGTCGACGTKTCRHCRKLLHPGVFCEEDQETKAVKELAMQKGWKSCPGCNHLIERSTGCLYMTCSRCQTAFCYRCSKRWNECESTCPDGEFLSCRWVYLILIFQCSTISNTPKVSKALT
jgi:hypothetical protein